MERKGRYVEIREVNQQVPDNASPFSREVTTLLAKVGANSLPSVSWQLTVTNDCTLHVTVEYNSSVTVEYNSSVTVEYNCSVPSKCTLVCYRHKVRYSGLDSSLDIGTGTKTHRNYLLKISNKCERKCIHKLKKLKRLRLQAGCMSIRL